MLPLLLYRLKRPYHFVKTGLLQGLPAEIRSKFVQKHLTIIQISGTDGKTTTATLLHHLLTQAGISAGLISTVHAVIANETLDTGFHVTSPDPATLYASLTKMKLAGNTHVVLEMTSHGAYQYRNWGILPTYGGITNITHEHLDYHVTYAEYAKAKLQQFKGAKKVFFPENDRSYAIARKVLRSVPISLYSTNPRLPKAVLRAIKSRFEQTYNQKNAILACLLGQEIGIPAKQLAEAVLSFPGVRGRLEKIKTKSGVTVVIDFAHTPNAVESVLQYLKSSTKGRLYVVLGCAGKRDVTKRPAMGRLAAQISDRAVFTAEDPRTESVWAIIAQMKSDLGTNHNKVISIADRGEAIHFVLTKLAKRGDTVAILGKGHESSMCFGNTESYWDDLKAVKQVLSTGEVPTPTSIQADPNS